MFVSRCRYVLELLQICLVRFRVQSHWTSSSYTVAAIVSILERYLVEEVSITSNALAEASYHGYERL
jgi:hypothetical protein